MASCRVADSIGRVIIESTTKWMDWRWQLSHCATSLPAVAARLDVSGQFQGDAECVLDVYPMRATPYYLSLVRRASWEDPVWIQCMPDAREVSGDREEEDPFAELAGMPVPGLIMRYCDRALVAATGECATYCRHCTRKNVLNRFVGRPCREYFDPVIREIVQSPGVREVIISGGDPLLLDIGLLDWLLGSMLSIDHVEVLRIGTRVPVVLPMRIDDELADMVASHRPVWVNTQFNHPVELTDVAAAACERLTSRGVPVSNQSVLLRGVNDDLDTMRALCVGLQRRLVRPYYVFQCDPVRGTRHLRVDTRCAARLEEGLRRIVGGLALPRFVADVPGRPAKVPIHQLIDT